MPRFSLPFLALFCFSALGAEVSTNSLDDAIVAARFGVRVADPPVDGFPVTAANPEHGFSCGFDGAGLAMEVRTRSATGATENFETRWSLAGIGRGTDFLPAGKGAVRGHGCRVEIARADLAMTEWFENGTSGIEHGFNVDERPLPAAEGRLTVRLEVEGDLVPRMESGGGAVSLHDPQGRKVASYDKLIVVDATKARLPARLVCEDGVVGIEIDDAVAVYPIVIDPLFRQQAFVKASNTGTGDAFGFAVALSGNTAVVGAPNEDSNARGFGGNQGSNSAMDSGAVYVFVRANGVWSQQAYLKSSNSDTEDDFGYSVALEGDTLVVGAPDEASSSSMVNGNQADNTFASAGAVYVFTRDSENFWTQQAYLKASNTGVGDRFGESIGLSGNTVVVGAPNEDSNARVVDGDGANNSFSSAGAAYVFVRDLAGTWTHQAYLKASNADLGDTFGRAVAVSGNVVVVGAPAEDSNASGVNGNAANNSLANSGAAYVFLRAGTSWTQQAYLKASNPMMVDQFGMAVAASGERVVVGAPQEDGGGSGVNPAPGAPPRTNSGAAYIFTKVEGGWAHEAYVKASNTEEFDEFGHAVAIEGNALAVSARREDGATLGFGGDQANNAAMSAGAVYVLERGPLVWTQRAYLKASNTGASDEFGTSVALSGGTLIAGAALEDSGATGIDGNGSTNNLSGSGAAYIFTGIGSGPVPLPVLATPVVDGSGDWTVSWSSTPGATYVLQRSHDLAGWIDVVTVVATGATSSHLEAAAAATEPTFWRVRSLCD